MNTTSNISVAKLALYACVVALGIILPIMFPTYIGQMTVLCMMIVFALTWDVLGGQMGYNSLGNIFFFGAGMYVTAMVQIGMYYDLAEYTSPAGGGIYVFSFGQYYTGMALGFIAAGIISILFAIVLGRLVFGLRGPYFAIGTLALATVVGELVSTWELVGGGGGLSMPNFPGEPAQSRVLFYSMMFVLAIATFAFLKWLYSTRFGLAINAIRDDEEKAEGMGIHTLRHKIAAWSISAFFLGIAGAIFGNFNIFVEPLEVAFPTTTFGIFMVLMVLLGGKGTLWGPVIGAVLFHIIKELTWTYLLGWQWVALGLLIVFTVVYFQQGIMGWVMEKYPHWFGIRVEGEKQRLADMVAGESK
jgi:branched-chain amino acid transport system permease protein